MNLNARQSVMRLVSQSRLTDGRFRRYWKNYLIQSGMAALALLIVMLTMDVVLQTAIVVAIASSAFIIFVMPHSTAATPRQVIGGHVVAVVVAMAVSALYLVPVFGNDSHLADDIVAVVAVGLSTLVMVVTSTEHPPAAGTALGLAIARWDPSLILFVLLGAVILTVVRALLRPYLVNLV